MQKRLLIIALLIVGGLPFMSVAQTLVSCEATFDMMYSNWDKIKTMQYHSKKFERHLDQENRGEFDFTIRRSPFTVAGIMTDKGHWILYDPAKNKKEALYISNGFPYTNLWLDINGRMFRGLNHYTISDAGCEFIFEIIRREYERIPENFKCTRITRKGNEEILIRAEADELTWSPYKAQPKETVLDIAKKHSASAYLLIENNANLSGYLDDCTGKTIMVPSQFGKVVELFVDAEHGMPMRIANYDEKGLFESYDYTDYRFNVELEEDFFTEDYLDDL
ncbi:MAG: hypothetical protein WEC59_10955 [Salibacteraceae bacterium]